MIIKYGISPDYLSHWSVKHAIREIMQNFIDYGEFNIEEERLGFTVSNDYKPASYEYLKIGFSDKSEGSVGKYGEGLKMAMLILMREDIDIVIEVGNESITPCTYFDDYLGECFGISIDDLDYSCDKFSIRVSAQEDVEDIPEGLIPDYISEDVQILHTSRYGDMIDKPEGDLYVGGLYVCNMKNSVFAFNIKPEYLELNRDRSFPDDWEFDKYSSYILEDYTDIKINDEVLESRCISSYNGLLPKVVLDSAKPTAISELGKVTEVEINDKKLSQGNLFNKIATSNEIIKQSKKLVYTGSLVKTPYQTMLELKDSITLFTGMSILNIVIEKSKNWTNKD